MSLPGPQAVEAVFRLQGTVGDNPQIFDLPVGEHRVGTLATCDVRLPDPGVSRKHAVLSVTSRGLSVADCGSTNGTFVGDERVERCDVDAGAELRFGPVRLKVEPLDAADRLAISFETPRDVPALTTRVVGKTPLIRAEAEASPAGEWIVRLEGFLDRMDPSRPDAPHRALAFLAEELGAVGGCFVAWRDGGSDPIALASWGEMHVLPPFNLVERLRPAPGAERPCRSAFYATEPALSTAFHYREDGSMLGLVLWGGRPPHGMFLRTLVRLVSRLGLRFASGREPQPRPFSVPGLVFPDFYRPGASDAMTTLYERIRTLCKGRLPVLIHGETGVGKELIARILHDSSDRAAGPFIAINCAAIPADLLEAEMFGVAKGVATGVEKRDGVFHHAEGGTLFLDEVGELAPALQPKLLRVLQEKEIQPLGGRPRKVDVRVVAATNVDLEHQAAEKGLRRDLYYRLAGGVLEVPPLRRCRDDVPGLVSHCLHRYAEEAGVLIRGVTAGAVALLRDYEWPGNVRELEHEMQRLAFQSRDGAVIDVLCLNERIRFPKRTAEPAGEAVAELDDLELAPRLEALERKLIREALLRTGGRQGEAARLLGLSRNGLAKKLKRLGLREGWALQGRE